MKKLKEHLENKKTEVHLFICICFIIIHVHNVILLTCSIQNVPDCIQRYLINCHVV